VRCSSYKENTEQTVKVRDVGYFWPQLLIMEKLSEDYLELLIFNHMTNDLSETEARDLDGWGEASPVNRGFLEKIEDDDTVLKDIVYWQQIDTNKGFAEWKLRQKRRKKGRRVKMFLRAATAAACLLFAIALGWLLWVRIGNAGPALSQMEDVQPGHHTKQVILPDGTHVWINNDSRLYYPAAFTGKQRMVKLSGEAYFEIAKNIAQPFVVKADGLSVEAIGTSFNVTAYKDEDSVQTTLITGSVKLRKGKKEIQLEPGEQGGTKNGSLGILVTAVDSMKVMAWKRGFFFFPDHSDLLTVLRQIARWYNVKVEVQGTIQSRSGYGGYIDRNLSLDDVLQILKYKDIQFIRTGDRLLVSQ
jgi:ferric-dicitrate binding protein FerR (iron transport regulator)